MNTSLPLSDQQNAALWVIVTFFTVTSLALFAVGVLGFMQRNGQSKA